MSDYAVICQEVVRIFRSRGMRYRALAGVSLKVREKERLCVIGKSGSGKSTLLQLIAGLDRPTSGEIRVLGLSLGDMNEDELIQFRKENVGFIFQDFGLLEMPARANVALPLMLRGVPEEERIERAEELLRKMGLKDHMFHLPSELSGGQKQRVAIARAMITCPKLLLCDEPTGNLDSVSAASISDILIEQTIENGTTMIMVTHDMEQSRRCAEHIVCMRDGKIEEEELL